MSAGSLDFLVTLGTSGFTSGVGVVRTGLGGLHGAFTGLNAAVQLGQSALNTLQSALAPLGGAIQKAADFETLQTGFNVLTGGAKQGQAALKSLADFAAATPFQLPEIATAGRSLLSFGISADALVPTFKNLGDIASGLSIPINELAQIYGKARVQGKLFAEDINQLTGRGIPIIQALASQFGVAESSIMDMVSKGEIGFPQLEKAFQSLTAVGGKFHDMMIAQSGTLNGKLSTLNDAWDTLQRTIAAPLATALKPLVDDITKLLGDLAPQAEQFGTRLGEAFTQARATIQGLFTQGGLKFVTDALGQALQLGSAIGVNYAIKAFAGAFVGTGELLGQLLASPGLYLAIGDRLGAAALIFGAEFIETFPAITAELTSQLEFGLLTAGNSFHGALINAVRPVLEVLAKIDPLSALALTAVNKLAAIKTPSLDEIRKINYSPIVQNAANSAGDALRSKAADRDKSAGQNLADAFQGVDFNAIGTQIGQAFAATPDLFNTKDLAEKLRATIASGLAAAAKPAAAAADPNANRTTQAQRDDQIHQQAQQAMQAKDAALAAKMLEAATTIQQTFAKGIKVQTTL